MKTISTYFARIVLLFIVAAIVALFLSSCSPKARVEHSAYRVYPLKGVNYKTDVPKKTVTRVVIGAFIFASILTL